MRTEFRQAYPDFCLAGLACFTLSTALMHVLQPDLNPLTDAVSYYMNGAFGWVLGLGLVALGAGSLTLLLGASRFLNGYATRAGRWALAVWAAGAITGGIFPPDPAGHWDSPPSASGLIHANAAILAFLAFPVAALRLSAPLGQFARSRPLQRVLSGTAGASLLSLLAFFVCLAPVFSNRPPLLLGLVERILLVFYVAWLCAAALAARRDSY